MYDKEHILDSLTKEKIIQLMSDLGSGHREGRESDVVIFQTICHNETGGSYKLYYYVDNRMFHCYTDCGENFDIFDLLERVKNYDFNNAIKFLANFLGIGYSRPKGFPKKKIDDWSVISKYTKEKKTSNYDLVPLNSNVLSLFHDIYHEDWIDEGITIETMRLFNIKYDFSRNRIIIPHYDIQGNLVGIRGRALEELEMRSYKYMPIAVQGFRYAHYTRSNLYGINLNLEAIQRIGKIMIVEGEKSVMKGHSYYGENNFILGTGGSTITKEHVRLILSMNPREIILGMDKEYVNPDPMENQDTMKHYEKLMKMAHLFTPYVTTYVIWDNDGALDLKDSPLDKGKDVLEELMKKKIEIGTKIYEDMYRR